VSLSTHRAAHVETTIEYLNHTKCSVLSYLHLSDISLMSVVVPDIPYRGSSEDGTEVESLNYVDGGTVNIVSTSRTARYWETRKMASHVNSVAASSVIVRTTTISFCSLLLVVVTCS